MKNTPAFPIQHQIIDANDINFKLGDSGMSLRDYFAAKALQGICVNSGRNGYELDGEEQIAARAYLLADAMMKARGK
jgi:hypothetical protein